MVGLMFESVGWMIKLTIILVVFLIRGLVLLMKALMIVAVAVIALIATLAAAMASSAREKATNSASPSVPRDGSDGLRHDATISPRLQRGKTWSATRGRPPRWSCD